MKSKPRSIPGSNRSPEISEVETFYQEDSDELLLHDAPILYDRSAEVKQKNSIAGWRLFAFGLLGVNTLFTLVVMTMLNSAISRASPTVVTRGNGQTETIDFMTGIDRPPSVIKLFAEKTISEIYTWRGYLPEKGSPPDPGIDVGKGKIPTTVYRYTFSLEPEFAQSFRQELAQLKEIAQGGNNASVETMYTPQVIGEPESLGSGKWKIKVAGFQLISVGKNAIPAMVRLDLELTVRAVPPPILSEVTRTYSDPGIAGAVMTARAMGLEITNIVNLAAKKP